MSERRLPVVVFGATGFTGTLICQQLERQGIGFAIGGRDPDRLRQLSDSLVSRPRWIAASVDDAGALRALALAGRVLISCAGPFTRLGPPVLDAALAAGTHWLDTTGEFPFLLATRARGAEARARGIAMVNAVGLDIVPSDAAASIAAEGLHDVEWVRVAVASRSRASRGTLRSMLEVAAEGGLAWIDGAVRHESVAAHRWDVQLPEPFGKRTCYSVPLADVVAAPASTGARNVRAFGLAPRFAAMAARAPGLRHLARTVVVRSLADRLIERLSEGPATAPRTDAGFAIVAEAKDRAGVSRRVWVTGPDAYDFTAASAVLCAQLAADPGFRARGALTPSQAFGARTLLDGLTGSGLRWGIEPLQRPEGRRRGGRARRLARRRRD